jgi:hypothetical protein
MLSGDAETRLDVCFSGLVSRRCQYGIEQGDALQTVVPCSQLGPLANHHLSAPTELRTRTISRSPANPKRKATAKAPGEELSEPMWISSTLDW